MKRLQLLLLIFAFTGLSAQDVKQEMALITAAYAKHTRVTMNVDYTMYETHTSPVVVDHKTGSYKRYDKFFRNRLETMESVTCKDISVYIDEETKQITLAKKTAFDFDKQFLQGNIDADLKKYKRVEVIPGKTVKGLRFWFKNEDEQQLLKYEVFYYADTHLVKQVNLYYNFPMSFKEDQKDEEGTKPRMEIVFRDIDLHPAISGKEFDLGEFVKGSGKKYTATEKYKGYSVTVF